MGKSVNSIWDQKMLFERSSDLGIALDRKISQLSGGQKHAVAVLLALAKEPSVMLLDEPLASLDPVIRRKLLGIFLSYAYDKDATIVLSSHLIGDLERTCDYIVFLSKGSVVLSQGVETLIGSHFWVTNSNQNQDLITNLMSSLRNISLN